MTNEAQLKFKETDEAYFARLEQAAHKIMDLFYEDETENPDYVTGFEHGYLRAVHALPTSCVVFTFGTEGDNRFYDDGFRDAIEHLGCTWYGDPESR